MKIRDEIKLKVNHLAQTKHRTAHWIMCEAIRKYVETEELKEDFQNEALASWEHYKETGLHITGNELEKWLSTWGTDNEIKAPKCHE